MKYKKRIARLQARIKWYESQNDSFKKANKKPGSLKK